MTTKYILAPLWVSVAMFAVPASAQTPDGMTPAVEGPSMCDPLANATPGLQGLCVAMCEAQDCEATMEDEVQEDGTVKTVVNFSPSCNNSAKQILANYDKLANYDPEKGPVDPPMPCVQVACPCWASDEIENIADENDQCFVYESLGFAWLYGNGTGGGREQALVADEGPNGLTCVGQEANPETYTHKRNISEPAYSTCKKSVVDECRRRQLY